MTRNMMNPLGIQSKRFIVAVDPMDDTNLYGWAQLRPIGPTNRDPNRYNSAPGSGSVEQDIDDEIWEEFEKDDADFSNGFASLPWTKEYRQMSENASSRRNRRNKLLEKAEEENANGINQIWELASVYVLPKWRNNGIGSELIRRVMKRHIDLGRSAKDVYLLTLDSTKVWYNRFGFEETNDPPTAMAFEMTAGGIITKLMAEKLVAMQGGHDSISLDR
jgi:GNAT superfamily N-acetyltransferase